MSLRGQNSKMPKTVPQSYYVNHRQYPGAYVRNDYQTRTGRRSHEGFSLNMNYGLDTQTDELNSSPYSSPYYVNGRFTVDNTLVTQRGNSASVQGIKKLLSAYDYKDEVATALSSDTPDSLTETTLTMWQGKQIKFETTYSGKIVGNTIRVKNTEGCTGLLSIYLSAKDGGTPLVETTVDLCNVSEDKFDTVELFGSEVFPVRANPRGKVYVRMEIWNEISMEKGRNPFNTGRKIEIAATGKGEHKSWTYTLGEKNLPVREVPDYKSYPSQPLIGFTYNNYESIPADRIANEKNGASVTDKGYRYDIFCVKDESHAEVLIYDRTMNRLVDNNIRIDARTTQLNIAQVVDTNRTNWVYYVDGYSPLQRFKIGEWNSMAYPVNDGSKVTVSINETTFFNSDLGSVSGTYTFIYENGGWHENNRDVSLSTYGITLSDAPSEHSRIVVSTLVSEGGTKTLESIEYVDVRPVLGASLIMHHNNRLYLGGFLNDHNLWQISEITAEGPDYSSFPYRFYTPNSSPYANSTDPAVGIVEYASDQVMIAGHSFFSLFQTNINIEDGTPQQVSSWTDSSGIENQGDICNYKGIVYSFNRNEGLRRFTGSIWNKLPATVDTHYDRVDMTKPRKLWGHSNKLYYNYTDAVDGKRKCLVWDMEMNYQQYPWFQDVDIPFCDIRFDDTGVSTGIHPDYPCILEHYAPDTWRRLDSPITFERHTKYITLPGNAADILVQRIHNKVLANCNRWWWFSIAYDKPTLEPVRGKDTWYRVPCWDTLIEEEPIEAPFPEQDVYERSALARLTLAPLKIKAQSVQEKIKAKTFRKQASLVSTVFEVMPLMYI